MGASGLKFAAGEEKKSEMWEFHGLTNAEMISFMCDDPGVMK